MEYKLLEPTTDLNKALDELTAHFGPIYTEAWVKEKAARHENKAFDMNVGVFANLWFSKSLKIILAEEHGKTTGYLIGMVFRPLTYGSSVFQIEDWYSRGDVGVTHGLFQYAWEACKFIGVDEIWVSHNLGESYPPLPGWKKAGETSTDRFIRE